MRRLLVLAAVGLALVLGSRFALRELTERAWTVRRQKLAELALVRPEGRRPWEVRFESLCERLRSSPRFDEIVDSPYRPYVAFGSDEPRGLDDFERLWVETMWIELEGLDAVLAALRKLPPEDLEWNGEPQRLLLAREWTNALDARAWLALETGDTQKAAQAYADALRLARATDDGSCIGAMIRVACEAQVLRATRAALAFGASAGALRRELEPLLAGLAFDPARFERAIRVDLAGIPVAEADEADPATLLARYAKVERWLALAREPASALATEDLTHGDAASAAHGWGSLLQTLHARHAQRNVALTALAVATHRERHGRFPAALADVTDLPRDHALDPLTGKPLPFWTDGATARIGPLPSGPSSGTADAPADGLDVWLLR